MKNKIFIIEHLEPELYPWCVIEYKHISKITGKGRVWFTNIKKSDVSALSKYGKVFTESVKDLKLQNVCILDPESNEKLTPDNSKNYQYFVFGGILGSYPAKKRTKDELTKFLPLAGTFNIGKEQMSTDNAVFTVQQIISGKKMEQLKFQDNAEIKINNILSTQLPYRYNVVKGKPLVSKELVKFIKNRDKGN